MLRSDLLKKPNNKKDLTFQIIDWSSNDIYKSVNKDDEDQDEEDNKYKKKEDLF